MFVFPETASCTCPFNYFPIQAKQVNKLKSFICDLVMGTIKHINKTNLRRVAVLSCNIYCKIEIIFLTKTNQENSDLGQ